MQQGTPKEIYLNPTHLFVAQFIGSHPANVFTFNNHYVTIRPEHILITPPENTTCLQLEGSLLSFEPLGGEVIYTVKTQIGKIQVKLENDWTVADKNVIVYLPIKHLLYFAENEMRVYQSKELEHDLLQYVSDTNPVSLIYQNLQSQ